jgi:hypothetical protein
MKISLALLCLTGCLTMDPDYSFTHAQTADLRTHLAALPPDAMIQRCEVVRQSWAACADAGLPPNECGYDPHEDRQGAPGCER